MEKNADSLLNEFVTAFKKSAEMHERENIKLREQIANPKIYEKNGKTYYSAPFGLCYIDEKGKNPLNKGEKK